MQGAKAGGKLWQAMEGGRRRWKLLSPVMRRGGCSPVGVRPVQRAKPYGGGPVASPVRAEVGPVLQPRSSGAGSQSSKEYTRRRIGESGGAEGGAGREGGAGGGNGGEGTFGGGVGGGASRVPQSSQSVPLAQLLLMAPGPPSSQLSSVANSHVFWHICPGGCGGGGGGESALQPLILF